MNQNCSYYYGISFTANSICQLQYYLNQMICCPFQSVNENPIKGIIPTNCILLLIVICLMIHEFNRWYVTNYTSSCLKTTREIMLEKLLSFGKIFICRKSDFLRVLFPMQINLDTNVYFIFSVLLIAFFMHEPVSLVQCITKMALIATLWTNFTFFRMFSMFYT